MPNYLTIVDTFPASDASGVYLNDVIWAQFSEPIDANTATYYNFSVTERETYEPVEGTVEVHGVSGNINDAVVMFIPTNGFTRNARYTVIASTAIKSKVGSRYLDHDTVWYFQTGNTASSGNIGDSIYDIDPSGFTEVVASGTGPTATGVLSTPLAVVSTSPTDYATNQNRNLSNIKIVFNDSLPDSIDYYDHLSITSKQVLD